MESNKRYTRHEDMSPDGTLTVIFQPDGDGIISITDANGKTASVEFCSPGAGGGRSPNVLSALRALAMAIERDNNICPLNNDQRTVLCGQYPVICNKQGGHSGKECKSDDYCVDQIEE